MKRILVATDGSFSSEEAIAFAVELASEHHSELIFVHVVRTIDVVPPLGLDDIGVALPHEPTKYDHALLRNAAVMAAERGVAATAALLGGSTVEEIVAAGESYGVDLIVVGSRGHGPLASALLGSVSLGVLRKSARLVLVVHGARPPHPAAETAGAAASA